MMFLSYLRSVWLAYQRYVEAAMKDPAHRRIKDMVYWQDRLFTNAILYALPLGSLALLPSIYLQYLTGDIFIVVFDIAAIIIVGIVALSRGITLHTRKIVVSVIVVVFSIVLIAMMGSFTIGCIYLFSLSVFVALQFSDRVAYGTVVVNVLICLGFALVLRYRLADIPLIHRTTANRWTVFSVNFIFMDLIVVGLIRQILNGLEHTMRKEKWLYTELKKEVAHKADLNDHLRHSEEDYRTLFYQSPLAKLIFDIDTLRFLQVNTAAVHSYGYTEQEFLTMKLTDIHPTDAITELPDQVHTNIRPNMLSPYRTQHLGKDGRRIHTEVRHSNITFRGKRARLIVATDITQRLNNLEAIQKQNEQLKEIAYMQSHVIRLPLARIMSLSALIAEEYDGVLDQQLLTYLNVSTEELDQVIREVVDRSARILAEHGGVR